MIERIPIILLTGFLGSGKTTLLARMLRTEQFADTAVLINELGAVGLDQHLTRGASETMRVLENGCVCCSVRDDLARVLEDLYWDRLHRRIPHFRRVVIETTGLAEPAPLLRTGDHNRVVTERYAWCSVICTVDGVHGARTLASRSEPARQVALADVLLITKVDLADDAAVEALVVRLRSLNPVAPQFRVAHGDAPDEAWLAVDVPHGHRQTGTAPTLVPRGLKEAAVMPRRPALHASDVRTFAVDVKATSADALERTLEAIAAGHAPRLLRLKGLVALQDRAATVVVQGVHERVYPLRNLEEVAEGESPSSLVFIIEATSSADADAIEHDIRGRLATIDVNRNSPSR